MRLLFAALALLGLVSYSQAQPASGPYQFHGIGYCQITVLTSAVAVVTASCSTGSVAAQSSIAQICVSGQGVRYRDDGTAPTASLGIPVGAGTCFQYSGPMAGIQFIQQAATATLDITFYN